MNLNLSDLITVLKATAVHMQPEVKEFADLAADIQNALDKQLITEQEYVNLMIDMERLKDVIQVSEHLSFDILSNAILKEIIEIAKTVKWP